MNRRKLSRIECNWSQAHIVSKHLSVTWCTVSTTPGNDGGLIRLHVHWARPILACGNVRKRPEFQSTCTLPNERADELLQMAWDQFVENYVRNHTDALENRPFLTHQSMIYASILGGQEHWNKRYAWHHCQSCPSSPIFSLYHFPRMHHHDKRSCAHLSVKAHRQLPNVLLYDA